jgi:hypothetical protein
VARPPGAPAPAPAAAPEEPATAPAANLSAGAAPSPAKPTVSLKPKPKMRVADAPKEITSASGNEPMVEQTSSRKVTVEATGPGGAVVALNFLAAAASVAFAVLLYLIYAKPLG